MDSINFWPVLIASVVAFCISALWYSPILFGKAWMKLANVSDKDVDESKKGMWKLYLVQFVITIVLFLVIGFLIVATGSRSAVDGMFIALILWVGFAVTSAVQEMLWQKTPLKLVLISELNKLVTWLIGGAIIGAWS